MLHVSENFFADIEDVSDMGHIIWPISYGHFLRETEIFSDSNIFIPGTGNFSESEIETLGFLS